MTLSDDNGDTYIGAPTGGPQVIGGGPALREGIKTKLIGQFGGQLGSSQVPATVQRATIVSIQRGLLVNDNNPIEFRNVPLTK